MIFWFILFFLIIAISFLLAYQSMRDFQENPRLFKTEYALYLLRNPRALDEGLIKRLYEDMEKDGFIVSIERLFRGLESALVIYGPSRTLGKYASDLALLELEDYTNMEVAHVQAWEIGFKSQGQSYQKLFQNLPALNKDEQFWWQLVIQPKPPLFPGKESDQKYFYTQIRAVLVSADEGRKQKLSQELQNLAEGFLVKLPKPFTSSQILEFYRQRALGVGKKGEVVSAEEILKLIRLN